MKLKSGSLALISLLAISPAVSADIVDEFVPFFLPEIERRNVEYIPIGHLHKNKARYGKYDWKTYESAHFEIQTYGNNENFAKTYLAEAEKAYQEFSSRTKMQSFAEKIQVVIFNSQRDFEETNLVLGLVPKGLGGQTEMIKWKRVLVAFRDSPTGFRRLLKHELTHRYQAEFLQITLINFLKRDVPLWFTEGSAEHMAHEWDARGELIMRDAYLHNYLAKITEWGPWYTSLIYKEGEFIAHFIAEQYKDKGDVISEIFRASAQMKFAEAFQRVTGDSLEEFERKLQLHIEKQYSPIRAKTNIADEAKNFGGGAILAAYNNFFITRKEIFGRDTLLLNWTDGNRVHSKKLVENVRLKSVNIRGLDLELSPEFGYQEHGASFASTDTIVYAVDIGGQDAIVIQKFSFDQKRRKFGLKDKNVYRLNNVKDAQYPVMISNNEIAFVGRDGVFAEILVYNRITNDIKKLTSARRTYRGLTYSPFLKALITSVENEGTNSYDLAVYDLRSQKFSLLTNTPENEFSAACSTDGQKLLYVSDKGLVHNIFLYDLTADAITQLTDVKIGVFRPQWFSENGMLFNAFGRGAITIKALPVSQTADVSKTETKTISQSTASVSEIELLRGKIPDVNSLTIFETVISSDKTKMLFIENRKLSMEILGKGDSEIRFHLVDTSSDLIQFTLKEFDRMKDFGNATFLAGTNILLQKHIRIIQKAESQPYEEEAEYKESYIYDWSINKLYDLDTELSSESEGSNRFLSKLSPERRYFIWVDRGRNNVHLYDIVAKKKHKLPQDFYEIQDAMFISDSKLLVLDKKRNLNLTLINLETNGDKTWKEILPGKLTAWDEVSWYPLPDGTKVFLLVSRTREKYLDVILFDTASGTGATVKSDIPFVKKAGLKEDKLILTVNNSFGFDQMVTIDKNGKSETKNAGPENQTKFPSYKNYHSKLDLLPRTWGPEFPIKYREKELRSLPRILRGYALGGVGFANGKFFSSLTGQILAFDEVNNKAITLILLLQNFKYGFADVAYYNLRTGRSYFIDYWNWDGVRQRFNVGVSQNIFLHPLLNWDVTLKEQYVNAGYGQREWWRTKVGTTFSVDTVVSDCHSAVWNCHGPHSGTAIFTGTEIGYDHQRGYQAVDLNLDARHYIPMTGRSNLAFRLAAGKSFGPLPTLFVWGGNKTFRGIPLFSQTGNVYLLQSSDLRIPIFDALGAVIAGPLGKVYNPFTVFMDVRGGLYNDVGDIWYTRDPIHNGHRNFQLQYSAGVFLNVPTSFGLNLRFNKGIWGHDGWNFWLGYNW